MQNSRFFDEKYYYFLRPDVFSKKRSAALHYLLYGWKEGTNPSEYFNTCTYLKTYPDINFNPLLHYELFGKNERRTAGIKPSLRGQLEALQIEVNNYRRQTAEIQLVVQEERVLRQNYANTIEELKKQINNITNILNSKLEDLQNDFESKLTDLKNNFESMQAEQRGYFEAKLTKQQDDFESQAAKTQLEQEKTLLAYQKQELERAVVREENVLQMQRELFELKAAQENVKKSIDNKVLEAEIENIQKNILQQAERKMSDKINALPESKVRNSRHINKEALVGKIEDFEGTGINEEGGRDRKIIVNLTSFPERMYDIHYCLYSLLNQSCRPDMLVLWLAEEEFPGKEKDIPSKVLKLRRNGLTIKWCRNLHSYKKLIPALRAFPNDILVTADDDIFYPENWLESLYESYLGNPEFIHSHRAHRIKLEDGRVAPYSAWEKCVADVFPSYLNFLTSGGGVLAVPGHFHRDMTEERLFRSLCPQGDDIWFWAMAVMNGTRVNVVKNPVNNITYINPEREFNLNGERTLFSQNKAGGNDKQLAAVLEHYPEIMEKLSRC